MKITIYTDGACNPNPGRGGYGAVLRAGPHLKEIKSEAYRLTTNNRMEILAAIAALEALKGGGHEVTLYTDSKYLQRAMAEGWPQKWQKKGWRRFDYQNRLYVPAMNPDLWQRLLDVSALHTVDWEWTRGHMGDPDNERADALAVTARNSAFVTVDDYYERHSNDREYQKVRASI